jgi:hypothetical protein
VRARGRAAESETLAALDDRLGGEIALVNRAQELECPLILDALGNHEGSGLPGEGRHREQHCPGAGLGGGAGDDASVELDELGLESAQHLKTGVARADIIDGEQEAMLSQSLQGLDHGCGATAESLGDLDYHVSGREPGPFDGVE